MFVTTVFARSQNELHLGADKPRKIREIISDNMRSRYSITTHHTANHVRRQFRAHPIGHYIDQSQFSVSHSIH